MKLLNRLKELRIENNFSQNYLAQILNVSRVCYNRYENGKREISLEMLCQLADLYDVSLDYLVGRVD